mmetsp:Transcript_14/g.85  ORF Transcript_14/g.85 Transcript_14/m.85 type:complete len:277 (+) Transcript_14:437-1267(+)
MRRSAGPRRTRARDERRRRIPRRRRRQAPQIHRRIIRGRGSRLPERVGAHARRREGSAKVRAAIARGGCRRSQSREAASRGSSDGRGARGQRRHRARPRTSPVVVVLRRQGFFQGFDREGARGEGGEDRSQLCAGGVFVGGSRGRPRANDPRRGANGAGGGVRRRGRARVHARRVRALGRRGRRSVRAWIRQAGAIGGGGNARFPSRGAGGGRRGDAGMRGERAGCAGRREAVPLGAHAWDARRSRPVERRRRRGRRRRGRRRARRYPRENWRLRK